MLQETIQSRLMVRRKLKEEEKEHGMTLNISTLLGNKKERGLSYTPSKRLKDGKMRVNRKHRKPACPEACRKNVLLMTIFPMIFVKIFLLNIGLWEV